MKNNECIFREYKIPGLQKVLRIMKLTFFLILLSVVTVFATKTYSQTKVLNLNMKNSTIKEVLKSIENQSEFVFMYSERLIDVNRKVSVSHKNNKIEEVLEELFSGTDITYRIKDRFILLTPPEVGGNDFAADQQTVSGTVRDETGQPLPGVTVVVKGTTQGTVTNANGVYTLTNIPVDATLVFSFVGMRTQEVQVGNQKLIDVELEVDAIGIEEVVAIGYGTMRKSDLTGSVSQVKTERLESVPVYNMEEALKVGAAGVRVSQNSGNPGARIEVRIRGGNSMIGDNQPLYVVDGFPVTGGINFLNPADIESVDILKDASATAIYGSRGANGVVIITSKRGQKGQESRIELNSFYGIQQELKRYDLLNASEYAIIANEWLKNEGQPPAFDVNQVGNPGTDWWDLIFRQAPVHNHTLTFSGSSEKTRYSLSGNYYDQLGIIENTGVRRGSARLNLDHELKDWLSMSLNMQLSGREEFSVPVDNGNRGNSIFAVGVLAAPPTVDPYDENGVPTRIEHSYPFVSNTLQNPLIYAGDYKNRTFGHGILANLALDFKIDPTLSLKTLVGLQDGHTLNTYFQPIIFENDRGEASERNSTGYSFLNENTITYSNILNEVHSLNLLGGFTYQNSMNRSSNISVNGFTNNATMNYDLGAAETVGNPSSGYSEWTLASFLARANYAFNNKYMVTASIRADGSSRFGADHKWGYFPSGAIAWRISDESFMQDIEVINSLKLRASYGMTGNTALSPYQSLNRLTSVKYIYSNQEDVIGFVPSSLSNSDLKWETTSQVDLGFDLNILNDRLRFVFDYYKKNTKDLLASVPLPPTVGFGSMLMNVGEIENEGIEFSVDADILRNAFKWRASAQISSNRNEVITIAGGSDIFGADQGAAWPSINIARVGEPLGAFYGLLEDGLDENGFIKYKDVSGPEGEPDGIVNSLDRVILGSYYPDFIYGFTSTFMYKNFEVDMAVEGVYGNEIFFGTAGTHLNSFRDGVNQFKDLIGNYWTEENPDPNAKYPKISPQSQFTASDRFIEDGSYLRLRSLRLAYNLPVSKMGISAIERLQVYISGTNLFTITKYPGIDPEVNTWGNDGDDIAWRLRIGFDQHAYPSAKTYALGLRVNF